MQKVKRIFFCLLIILFINSSCSAQTNREDSEKICNVSFSNLDGLPKFVLAGTDVVKLSSFSSAEVHEMQNHYSAEFGGATITLRINPIDKTITRTFQEPGLKPIADLYSPYCKKEKFIIAENLKGIIVGGGLLLLEEKPEIDGIPNNLWVYYKTN